MTITFTWAVNSLDRKLADGYVFTAHYNVMAETEDLQYKTSTSGSISFQRPDTLIPYEELTQSLVLSWIKQTAPVADIEADLEAEIELQQTTASGLPWAQPIPSPN
jgi:hypothetical protein